MKNHENCTSLRISNLDKFRTLLDLTSTEKCGSGGYFEDQVCTCLKNFKLENGKCVKEDLCDPNPCPYDGVCENNSGEIICRCASAHEKLSKRFFNATTKSSNFSTTLNSPIMSEISSLRNLQGRNSSGIIPRIDKDAGYCEFIQNRKGFGDFRILFSGEMKHLTYRCRWLQKFYIFGLLLKILKGYFRGLAGTNG